MIGELLLFLKNQLNGYVKAYLEEHPEWLLAGMGGASEGPEQAQDRVVFLDGESKDSIVFKQGVVSTLLINLEEERTQRPADRYRQLRADGTTVQVQPEIRLNLYVLFVANFTQYEQGLQILSLVIRYFQSRPVLSRQSCPQLSDRIEKLALELVTLSFSEQNEVWSVLKTTYRPSVLYRVKMLAFQDQEPNVAPELVEPVLTISQKTQ